MQAVNNHVARTGMQTTVANNQQQHADKTAAPSSQFHVARLSFHFEVLFLSACLLMLLAVCTCCCLLFLHGCSSWLFLAAIGCKVLINDLLAVVSWLLLATILLTSCFAGCLVLLLQFPCRCCCLTFCYLSCCCIV